MNRSLAVLHQSAPARTCVWSDAGVLANRLCDRGFACESCVLDAALRGDARLSLNGRSASDGARRAAPLLFPADRLYAAGRLWAQIVTAGTVRVGLDACAAWLVPALRSVRFLPGSRFERGEVFCALGFEAGELPLSAPVRGELEERNERLAADPSVVTGDPYSAGWIAAFSGVEGDELTSLEHQAAAARSARLAVRRFGRRAALELLSVPDRLWGVRGFPGAARRVVGETAYLKIVRDALR